MARTLVSIDILSNGVLQVKYVDDVTREIHRDTVTPCTDLGTQDAAVQAAAAEAWTPGVIAAYEASLPPTLPKERLLATRDVLRRLTDAEYAGLLGLRAADPKVARLWDTMMAGSDVHLANQELADGLTYVCTVAVPTIWKNQAAAQARMDIIFAPPE